MKEIGGYKTIESALHTDFTTGLSNHNTKDLEERKEAFGSNEKPTIELPGILELLWDALQDFTLRILVLASIFSIVIEMSTADDAHRSLAWIEGFAIMVAVIVCASVAAINDY